MKKRALAAFLWFYAGLYLGAMLADILGLNGALLGPVLGAAAAGLIALDPRRIVWSGRPARSSEITLEPV